MNETYQDLEVFLTKDKFLADGWWEESPSPNGMLHYLRKGDWKLKFYRNEVYMAPLELSYIIHEEKGCLDSYRRISDPFNFHIKDIASFRFICKTLGI